MRVPLGAVVLAMPGALVPASSADPPTAARQPIVLHVCGIGVGMLSTDDEVVALHGEGLYVEGEGHLGGRYFTNASHSVTLHTVIGVDMSIESVELTEGLHIPGVNPSSVPSSAVSPAIKPSCHADHGITLGMSPTKLIETLGLPAREEVKRGRRILIYATTEEGDDRVSLAYEARYEFERSRLLAISLYDGE